MKKLKSIFLAVILFFSSLFVLNSFLEKNINKFYSNEISSIYGNTIKDKGLILQKKSIDNNNLMIYGSSELGVNIEQNPVKFFPNKDNKFIVDLIGRGYCQSLKHGINFGALGNKLNNKDGVFVVSLQWFVGSGIDSQQFLMNFSEMQFYRIMDNKQISNKTKKKICERVYKLVGEDPNFKHISMYCSLYSSGNYAKKVVFQFMKPYYSLKKLILKTDDNLEAYKLVLKYKDKRKSRLNGELKNISWSQEFDKAEQQGKNKANNNKFYINNEYYNKYYKEKLPDLKNTSKNTELLVSEEFQDLDLMMDICKDINFKPMFVLMPTNGRWYDYIGVDKKKRVEFYDKVYNKIKERGFTVYRYDQYEYQPYFMEDAMHLGWKGWLTVDETISRYYKENEK
ncbi:D-alanyl-lipoteichoic acid biosynthesis protein DltD [Clostridium niameyense]|uniref:D-alanyl-lipoteichoic acid biosynthesis protein DltD n=1 Tax=Clostridium niameyense TaxID=1622073 RepID=UPI00067F3DAB|nr:D-alanyl-lipoteichoic acid biosynthesis protein DltD [Clostridium niameyense]